MTGCEDGHMPRLMSGERADSFTGHKQCSMISFGHDIEVSSDSLADLRSF